MEKPLQDMGNNINIRLSATNFQLYEHQLADAEDDGTRQQIQGTN